ncbi:transferrin [Anoplophora glabripennis]|uniref:transferrin n=1 Tax=Anoplophora glabripennis TaxID=217634 RepID=UPI000C789387|nr:transferrin [Anoplophora glabripennis]
MLSFGRFVTCTIAALSCLSLVYCEKYKFCMVDGKGGYMKSGRYCPNLDIAESKVECVVALDRLDCLRRLSKGTADFSVFTAEDLVTAQNSKIEVLVTNELRYNAKDNYEYEVVAVVNNNAGIKSKHDLKGKRFCHPGYGYETDWTRILANYFEASVVTPSCDTDLTITENRIKATAEFFEASCKAGPWVNNPSLNIQLKQKYAHLCELCGNPSKCSINDEYWGRRGSLLCLTDGAGDISWARLDDVKTHFGLQSGLVPDQYSLLCPDDSLMPLTAAEPCIWVVKPWPVVASRRSVAQEIQEIVSSLSPNVTGWRQSVLKLLETSYTVVKKVDSVEPIESYLHRATGFLSANSFSGCHPPRTINICTTSIIENAKCAWMRESAAVYGLEPDLECIKADNTTHCMVALNQKAADIVMVPSDLVHRAEKEYNLTTLFYETVNVDEKYITVAVTKPESNIKTFADLRGKKACFPVYDGVAWNTVKKVLFDKQLIKNCPLEKEITNFFGPSCTPGLPDNLSGSMKKTCQEDTFNGEFGALQCLSSGAGDVAFVSRNSIKKFVSSENENSANSKLKIEDFKILCESKTKPCHLSWAPLGQGMIRNNSTDLWKKDTLDVFLRLDNLFGKSYQSLTTPFTMFGKYDGKSDLLFHDATIRLRSVATSKDFDTMVYPYKDFLNVDTMCINSNASRISFNGYVLLFIAAVSVRFCFN